MIYGGQAANASARHRKQERREVCSVKVAAPVYLDWSNKPITFDQGRYPLVVDPVIGNARLTKVLMDGGSSLNIIYADTLGLLGIDFSMIRAGAAPFHGIIPGKPSRSRWSGSEEPIMRCWGDRATPSSWSSPTTRT
jgi:hypothetical protein